VAHTSCYSPSAHDASRKLVPANTPNTRSVTAVEGNRGRKLCRIFVSSALAIGSPHSPAHHRMSAAAEPPQAESAYEQAEKARLRKQAPREQSDGGSASATLAQRLLQGWAMLSATCPEQGCHNPLMRDRSGKEQCVTCGAGGAAASSTPRHQPAAAAEVAAAAAASAAVPVQAAGDFAGEMETEDEDDQAMLDGGAGRVYAERRMEELLAASAAGPAAEGKMARAATSDAEDAAAVDRSRVRSQALDTLYRALDLSQRRLRACSSSPSSSPESFDVNESLRQADLVARLAVAARAVLDLPSGS